MNFDIDFTDYFFYVLEKYVEINHFPSTIISVIVFVRYITVETRVIKHAYLTR